MDFETDILVVGGGVIGASAAYYLTQQTSSKVLLCEQSRPPGIGSTRLSGGILRMHHTGDIQAHLAWESLQEYMQWEPKMGRSCDYVQTGFALLVGHEHLHSLHLNTQMMKNLGIPVHIMSPIDFQDMNPCYSMQGIEAVAYEPLGGYADPLKATLGFIQMGKQHNLTVMEGTKVERLLTDDARVTGVKTSLGTIRARLIILAGGIWTRDLVNQLDVTLPLETKHIGVTLFQHNKETCPFLITAIDDTRGIYFRRISETEFLAGLSAKVAHIEGSTTDNCDYLDQSLVEQTYQHVQEHFGQGTGLVPIGTRKGFDAYTEDGHPVIGPVTECGHLYIATGFSGGGFKIAPAVGRRMAQEIVEQREDDWLKALRPGRFQTDQPIVSEQTYAYV